MKIFRGGDRRKLPQRKGSESPSGDRLSRAVLNSDQQLLLGQSGVPESADGLSYEPVQRLLAVSCGDGRVKIIGQNGVERTLVSNCPAGPDCGTQQVHFLPSRGVVVRISQGGSLELWGLEDGTGPAPCPPLETVKPRHDGFLCLSSIRNEPYLVLGCVTGAVRVAMLLDAAGSPVDEARPVKHIQLLPYYVTPEMMASKGYVMSLAAKSSGPVHRLLVQHSRSDVVVWDLRAGIPAASLRTSDPDAPPALSEAGSITCTCWAGGHGRAEEFITGHSSGDVLAWSLPLLDPTGTPQLLRKFRLVGSEPAASIRHLEYVGNRNGHLLVLGGQQQDAPDSFTLLPVPGLDSSAVDDSDGSEEAEDAVKVPWFGNIKGYALVPARGSFGSNDDPGAIIVLLDGGQLQVHDLKANHQVPQPPSSLPLQSGPKVVLGELYSIPEGRLPGMGVSAVTMGCLRQLSADLAASGSKSAQGKPWTWVLAGGEPPIPPQQHRGSPQANACTTWGSILCTGHDDGVVKVWDMFAEQPRLLLSTPSPEFSKSLPPPSLRPVTALHLFWPHGLLFTGHERGEARVYQLNHSAGPVSLTTVDGVGDNCTTTDVDQKQGLQLRTRMLVHSVDITCISYCAGARLAAFGDEMGAVSLLHTTRAQLLWYVYTRNQPVRSLEVGMVPVQFTRGTGSPTGRGETVCAVVLACDSSELGVLDDKGQPIGNGWLKPKNLSQVLYMTLLDGDGNPLWMASDKLKSTYGDDTSCPPSQGGSPLAPKGMQSRSASPGPGAQDNADARLGASGESTSKSDKCNDEEDEDEEDEEAFLAKAAEAAASSHRGGSIKSLLREDDKKSRVGGSFLGRGSTPNSASSKASPKTPGWPQMTAFESVMSADSLSTPSDEPEALYALVVTVEYLRVYTTSQVIQGDRSTILKKRLSGPALFASTFHANRAPAVTVVVGPLDNPSIQVYSLPNLEPLLDTPLGSFIPWTMAWPDAPERLRPRFMSASHTGQLTMFGRQSEVVRCALTATCPPPARPSSLFDWELAAAAHAAQLAVIQATLRNKRHQAEQSRVSGTAQYGSTTGRTSLSNGISSSSDYPQLPTGTRPPRMRALGSLVMLVNQVNQGVNQALNETSKGLQNLVQPKEPGFSDYQDPVVEHYKSYPSLSALFSRATKAESDEEEEEAVEDDERPSSPLHLGSATFTGHRKSVIPTRDGSQDLRATAGRLSSHINRDEHRTAAGSVNKGGLNAGDDPFNARAAIPVDKADAANRAELLGNNAASAAGRVRTADEIRAAYGRPAGNKGSVTTAAAAAASSSIFEQTRQALGERGDKLARLQDKTAAMESDAANFAAMARQLAEKEKNRKWWQL